MAIDLPTNPHALPADDVVAALEVDASNGLDWGEARRRLDEFGLNEVESRRGSSALVRFLLQFHQPLIYILIAAGIVTILLAEYIDAGVILGVVVLNATAGYIQEARALAAMSALSKTLAQDAVVLREGDRHKIPAPEVVPGDIVFVGSGDKVPADMRLLHVRDLQVEEAAFTGESVPVYKTVDSLDEDADLGDRTSMAYSSTLVTSGRGHGVVVATGGATEVGRISELIESADDIATPLTRRISWLSHVLLVAILGLAGVTFGIGLAHGEAPADVFLASVALAVAAIPEGLPAVITITLAIGVSRMARRRAIIRRLPAVETLGSTTVVCSDKTGTLTENQMTVQKISAGSAEYDLSGSGYQPEGELTPAGDAPGDNLARDRCLLAGLLCNDASLVEEEGQWRIQGDPTEGALLVSAAKTGLSANKTEDHYPRLDTVPFESLHQYMATLHSTPDGDRVIFLKGSIESVLDRCGEALTADGERQPLDRDAVLDEVRRLGESGLRVLAFAQKEAGSSKDTVGHDDVDGGLTFLGLQGMIDPPRDEAIDAVRASKEAGITVKMITGDHAVTAAAIARQLGIGHPGMEVSDTLPEAMSGRELAEISDEDLPRVARDVHVFARIPPDGKLRLVRALQSQGHIVAMTGDGVNDGPALRQADIGVAMGLSGTEVAREASDMVLTDDNFASIRAAIEEGRGVFDNLTKFLVYILPTNLGQALVILLAILLGTTLPMLPVQVLWVNMTTAVFLGLMLAFEPSEEGIMNRPPRDPRASFITIAMGLRMLLVSAVLVVGAFGLFHWAENDGQSVEVARTVAVNVFIVVQICYLMNCRSLSQSMTPRRVFTNLWVVGGIVAMATLQLAFTYLPIMNTLFQTEPIGLKWWPPILAFGLAAFTLVEFEKILRNVTGRPIQPPPHGLTVEPSER